MNVAHHASAHAAKAGPATGAHHPNGKGQAGNDTAGAEGFMALFAALGADTGALPGVAKDDPGMQTFGGQGMAVPAELMPTDPLAVPELAMLASAPLAGSVGGTADEAPLTGVGQTMRAFGAGLPAQDPAAAATGGDPPPAPPGALPVVAGADAVAAARPGAVVTRKQAHADAKEGSDVLQVLMAQVQSTDAGGVAVAAAASTAAGKGQGAAVQSTPSEVQLADSRLAAELRMAVDTSRQLDTGVQKLPGAEAVLLAASADAATRDVQRSAERGASRTGAWSADTGSIVQGFALTGGATVDRPPASVDVSSLQPPEVQVAEQINYWVSREVQNAELKLDGLGANPVEVSISLVGQEARVEFRTDQAEIRQVLENAMPHLKEMLQNQGLTLTGTSVGTSGQGGEAGQEQKNRSDMRQAQIALANLAPTQTARRMDSSLGGAVDYFV